MYLSLSTLSLKYICESESLDHSDSRDVFLSVCVWCVILGAKRKVMLWSKKSRERRESSKIGHIALCKNTRAKPSKSCSTKYLISLISNFECVEQEGREVFQDRAHYPSHEHSCIRTCSATNNPIC